MKKEYCILMKLKQIAILSIVLMVVLLVVVVLILFHYGHIKMLEGTEIIVAGVGVISIISIILKVVFRNKINTIHDRWHNLFEPMIEAIEIFKREMRINASNPSLINNIGDLKTAIENIEYKTTQKPNKVFMKIQNGLFGDPKCASTDNLNTFLDTIKNEINALKDELRNYE